MKPHLLLTYDFPPMGGGIARVMGECARRYPASSLVVSTGLATGGQSADAACPNTIDRIQIPARRLRTLPGLVRWSRRAQELAVRHEVEFAWCGQLRPAGYPARWLAARRKIPYGVIVYGGDLLALQQRIIRASKRWLAQSLLERSAVIVAISEWTADRCRLLLDDLGLHPVTQRIVVVPLGTDPERFRPGVETGEIQSRLGLPPGQWLLTVARLVPHKGIDTGIDCLASLVGETPGLRYAVAGTGPDRPRLEALARDRGVFDRVHFLGEVSDTDLPALYNLADVYLAPSRQQTLDVEGFGIAIVEASASGLPVVACRSGGIAQAVREGETAILVEPGDLPGLVAATRSVLKDAELRRALGFAGRQAAVSFYNWDRVVTTLRDLGRARAAEAREAGSG